MSDGAHSVGDIAGAQEASYFLEPLRACARARGISGPIETEVLREAGIPLQRFKRSAPLARVQRVLGILRGLAPTSLLDIGSGRGAFLWPLMDGFGQLPVLSAELSSSRLRLLAEVRRGGVRRLAPIAADVRCLPLAHGAVDVATCLEVLEHLPLADPLRAVAELCRVARRFVVISVPSRPDDNPEHLQVFEAAALERLFLSTGRVRRVSTSYVHNHLIQVATLAPGAVMSSERDDGLRKYPRTQHIQGSRLQVGDEDLEAVPLADLAGRHLVIEEKIDGANCGISFGPGGADELLLQSRGHYLTGGHREKHFALLKTWASCHQRRLYELLGSRYVLYGEWAYAKHTIFYDALPHYLLEFDVLDRETGAFLDTSRRDALLDRRVVVPVPVLYRGPAPAKTGALAALIEVSLYKTSAWREGLVAAGVAAGVGEEQVWVETDSSELSEGLYIKVEEGGEVVERYKYVRASFLTAVVDSGSHWLSRPIVENGLAEDVDIYASKAEPS